MIRHAAHRPPAIAAMEAEAFEALRRMERCDDPTCPFCGERARLVQEAMRAGIDAAASAGHTPREPDRWWLLPAACFAAGALVVLFLVLLVETAQ